MGQGDLNFADPNLIENVIAELKGRIETLERLGLQVTSLDHISQDMGNQQSGTFSGNITIAGTTVALEIADNVAENITPLVEFGWFTIVATPPDAASFGIIAFDVDGDGAACVGEVLGTGTNVTTGELTGTTGTDGKLTVSAHTDGKIYIENRTGGAITVLYGFLPAAQGMKGDAGVGVDGDDGKTILSGSGAPAAGLGVDGDYYLDIASFLLYGPKATTWPAGVSIRGPQGDVQVANIGSAAETVGGSKADGTATTAARSDHKHEITNPKLDDLAATDDNTDLNASTTKHGLLLKAVAPAASLMNVPGIVNGETVWSNKPVFDATNPAALGTAGPGTAVTAAHRDHVHTLPKLDDCAAPDNNTDLNASSSAHGLLPILTNLDYKYFDAKGVYSSPTRYMLLYCVERATSITTGIKFDVYIPLELAGMNLTEVAAYVITAGSTNSTVVSVYNATDSVEMLSDNMQIETGEYGTNTSSHPGTIDTTHDDVVQHDHLQVEVDSLSSTAPKGLYVLLGFKLP